ncbi:MAG: hypothetical protein WCP34_15960 [Pseudomonadota bacterium]
MKPSSAKSLGILLLLFVGGVTGAAQPALPSLSPKAEDLSRAMISTHRPTTTTVAFEALDNSMDATDRILAAHARRAGDADVLTVGGKADKALLSAHRNMANRKGKVLSVGRPNGKGFQFRDGYAPGGYKTEGGGSTFVYAGPLGTSGYHKVDTFSGRDPPGSFLVNPENGAALYVRPEADLVSISTDQKMLAVMNNGLDSPFSILIALFDQRGYSIHLQCQSHMDGGIRQRIIPFFKGWHRNSRGGFDLVLLTQRLDDDPSPRFEAVPVRFSFRDGEWHVYVNDPARFTRSTRLTCWQ